MLMQHLPACKNHPHSPFFFFPESLRGKLGTIRNFLSLKLRFYTQQQGGYVWFYPKKEHISIQGAENLSYYVCASGNWRKAFCKTCGVQIMNDLNPLSDEEVAAQPEEARERRNRLMGYRPVNMRTLDNFDLDTVKVSQASTSEKMEPLYVNP